MKIQSTPTYPRGCHAPDLARTRTKPSDTFSVNQVTWVDFSFCSNKVGTLKTVTTLAARAPDYETHHLADVKMKKAYYLNVHPVVSETLGPAAGPGPVSVILFKQQLRQHCFFIINPLVIIYQSAVISTPRRNQTKKSVPASALFCREGLVSTPYANPGLDSKHSAKVVSPGCRKTLRQASILISIRH